MKVVIAGGGTGGHLYPGIAIARELQKETGNAVLFVGTEQGIESRVLPKENLELRLIKAGRLKGMRPAAIMRTMVTLPYSLCQSFRILREVKPDIVIGVGGYASGPLALAAWLFRLPLMIIEPNSYAGLANRVLGRLADSIILTYPGIDQQNLFPASRKVLIGPLVRNGINQGDREQAMRDFELDNGRFTVFVMGGSGGAHALNMAMKEAAPELGGIPNLQVLHQTGEKDSEEVKAAYDRAGVKAKVMPYIHDMAGAYAAADLVVSRSGATTVAELAVCGKRALLVPFPYAADNHQEYNARTLARRGVAEVMLQKELTPGTLAARIRFYASGGGGIAEPAPQTAAQEIVRMCRHHVQKN